MTAVNIIKQKRAVHMITDGASWFAGGGFGPAVCKAWPLPHLRTVVSGRGPRLGPMLFADYLNVGGRSYDEAKANAVEMAQRLWTCSEFLLGSPFGDKVEFVVAGWSESIGPDAFVISRNESGLWQSRDTGPVMMSPGEAETQQAALRALPAGVESADQMDPARDGLTIIQAQRAWRSPAQGTSVVGGFVQLTTVTLEGIQTRILHSWPDEWGAPMVTPAEKDAS